MGQNGFYCEIEGIDEFTPGLAEALEGRMRDLVAQDLPISRMKILTSEVRARYAAQGLTDKIALLDTRPRLYSDLYTLGDTDGYFYGALAPSTGFVDLFGIEPYYNGFYLALPLRTRPTGSTPTSNRKRCSASSRNTSPGCGSWACPPWAPSTPRCSRATRAA